MYRRARTQYLPSQQGDGAGVVRARTVVPRVVIVIASIASLAAIGHALTLFFLWRWLGRGHGVIGILIVVAVAVLFLVGMMRRRGGFGRFGGFGGFGGGRRRSPW